MYREVICALNRIQREFLWGSIGGERKFTCVKMRSYVFFERKGRLGIKDLKTFNKALAGKGLWRLLSEKEGL